MTHYILEAVKAAIIVFIIFILPFFLSYHICKNRNRSVAKGLFVTFCLGWLASVLLWLGLKTRDKANPKLLY